MHYLSWQLLGHPETNTKKSDPIGTWKCNFSPFFGNYDRTENQLTNRWTLGFIGKLHFKHYIIIALECWIIRNDAKCLFWRLYSTFRTNGDFGKAYLILYLYIWINSDLVVINIYLVLLHTISHSNIWTHTNFFIHLHTC